LPPPSLRISTAALLCVAILLQCACGFALQPYTDRCADEALHAQRLERFASIFRSYKTMGASVVLFRDGQIVDVYHYGKANRADGVAVDDTTLFRIGSITKMVTAMALMRLWELGAFDLDADVGDYFGFSVRNPSFPRDVITIRQIMTHTASLLDTGHYNRAIDGELVQLETVFNGQRTSMDFSRNRPGTKVDYANFGGGLLGSLIELFTGLTADEWLQESLFRPLGITASLFTPNLPEGTTIARIYGDTGDMHLDPMTLTNADTNADFRRHYTYTAGALSISALDLAALMMALADGGTANGVQLLQPETVAMMLASQDFIGSVQCESGRGLDMNIIAPNLLAPGRTLYGHQGKAYGMICAAYCDPTDHTGVVLLTNGCDDSTLNSVARIAKAVVTEGYRILDAE